MNKTIVVVDGLGGGLGAQIVAGLRERLGGEIRILALGTNSSATERMLKAGADRGASGENAIRVSAKLGDVILGPIGIVIPNGLMGEITPETARTIMEARGERILLPVPQNHFILAGRESRPLGRLVEDAVERAAAVLGSGAPLAQGAPAE